MNDNLTCEVIDNFVFKYSGGLQVYDHLLNVSVDQTTRFSKLNIKPKYTATFEENDPYRAIYSGRVPSTAAFQDKIDGAGFKRTGCDFTVQESKMNVEPINYYDYNLPSLQSKKSPIPPDIPTLTIYQKRYTELGDLYCRNTLSTKIQPVSSMLKSLPEFEDVVNNIIDYEVLYDTMILYTSNSVYLERFRYNHTTGEHLIGDVSPVYIKQDTNRLSKIIRGYLNETTGHYIFGKTVMYSNAKGIIPELYMYDIDTGTYKTIYSESIATARDLSQIVLPADLYNDFNIRSVGTPILTYNSKLKKYTVVCDAELTTTYTGKLTGEYASKIFCVFIHNFKLTQTGMSYMDSIIYHPQNKREYRYDNSEYTTYVKLSSHNIDDIQFLGESLPANAEITVNPLHLPVRESKLKEITYRYDDKVETVSRLPVNDPQLAGITSIKDMIESYVPTTSGAPLDFASPRYNIKKISPETNMKEVSIVDIQIEAVYYDGHKVRYRLTGEVRPRPIDYVFGSVKLVDAVSYTTDSNTSMVKLILETQNPAHVLEYAITNTQITPSNVISSFELESPALSTDTLSSVFGDALSASEIDESAQFEAPEGSIESGY
jgi:hypothetical protein